MCEHSDAFDRLVLREMAHSHGKAPLLRPQSSSNEYGSMNGQLSHDFTAGDSPFNSQESNHI